MLNVICAESEARRSPAQHFGRIMSAVWAGGLRLWSRLVSLRIVKKIRPQANRGRRRRNFEAECYATVVPALPCTISPYFI
jgi:hypothetical protein